MNLKHYDHDGRARFVTFCTHNKIALLTNSRFNDIVLSAIDKVRNSVGFTLIAYVIMPEHVHLVMHPRENTKVGYIIGEIKRLSSRRIHSLLKSIPEHEEFHPHPSSACGGLWDGVPC